MTEIVPPDPNFRLDVQFHAPPDDLQPCFTTIYRMDLAIEDGRRLTDFLQPEWSNLRFFCGEAACAQVYDHRGTRAPKVTKARFQATGPTARPVRFDIGSSVVWGIGLKPLGWARYVGKPAAEAVDLICDGDENPFFSHLAPLCEILCDADRKPEDQLADVVAFFRAQEAETRDDARILAIHEAMIDPHLLSIDDFADAARMHKRTLERLCRKHFGFSPRFLLRRQRMMRSLMAYMLADGASWSRAIDRHYHDQSHFVREFHGFMGMSPSEYVALPHPVLDAFIAERQRVWGSPAQVLDAPHQRTGGKT